MEYQGGVLPQGTENRIYTQREIRGAKTGGINGYWKVKEGTWGCQLNETI